MFCSLLWCLLTLVQCFCWEETPTMGTRHRGTLFQACWTIPLRMASRMTVGLVLSYNVVLMMMCVVWSMVGTAWYMKGDPRLRTKYKQKIPQVQSQLRWSLQEAGKRPPLGQTHDQWMKCDRYFSNTSTYVRTVFFAFICRSDCFVCRETIIVI